MRDGWIYHAFWNAEALRDLFTAAAHVTSLSGWGMAAQCAVLAGFVLVTAGCAVRGRGTEPITYFACVVLFWFAAVVPRTTVVVHDVRTDASYPVDGVPLGLAVTGSFASQIGHFLSESYEEAFSLVDAARFSKFGAVFPERVIEVLQAVGPVTAQAREELSIFSRDCVMPELLADPGKAAAVTSSPDLWSLVRGASWINPARRAAWTGGTVLTCSQAADALEKTLTDVELTALRDVLGARLVPDAEDPGALLSSAVGESEELLLGLSRSLDQSLRHSLLLTALPQAAARVSEEGDAPLPMAVTLARAQGNLAAEINYRTMAEIAEQTLPRIRSALEYVLLAVFPVVCLTALASGPAMGVLVKGWFLLLLSVQIWPALASVVNSLLIAADVEPFGELMAAYGGNTLMAANLIRETGASSQAIAGMLMLSVPVLSWALVQGGSMAMTHWTGSLTQPAASAASSAGSSLSAGNFASGSVSVGNVSTNNRSSNHSDESVRTSDGAWVRQDAWGTVTRSAEGMVTGAVRTGIDLGVSSTSSTAFERAHSVSHQSSQGLGSLRSSAHSDASAVMNQLSSRSGTVSGVQESASSESFRGTEVSAARGSAQVRSVGTSEFTGRTTQFSEGSSVESRGGVGLGRGPASSTADSPWGTSPSSRGGAVSPTAQIPGPAAAFGAAPDAGAVGPAGPMGRSMAQTSSVLPSLEAGVNLSTKDSQSLQESAGSRADVRTDRQNSERHESSRRQGFAESRGTAHLRGSSESSESAATQSRSRQIQSQDARWSAHDERAGSSLTDARRGMDTVSATRDAALLSAAVAQYGSPEAALRAFFGGDSSSFAGDRFWETADGVRSGTAASGAGSLPDARERAAELPDRIREQGEYRPQGLATAAPTDVSGSGVGPSPMDRPWTVPAVSLKSDASITDLERGIALAVSRAWQEAAREGDFTARGNAFGFGVSYRSPEEMRGALEAAARNHPETAELLTRAGRDGWDSVAPEAWRTVELGLRQAQGDSLLAHAGALGRNSGGKEAK